MKIETDQNVNLRMNEEGGDNPVKIVETPSGFFRVVDVEGFDDAFPAAATALYIATCASEMRIHDMIAAAHLAIDIHAIPYDYVYVDPRNDDLVLHSLRSNFGPYILLIDGTVALGKLDAALDAMKEVAARAPYIAQMWQEEIDSSPWPEKLKSALRTLDPLALQEAYRERVKSGLAK